MTGLKFYRLMRGIPQYIVAARIGRAPGALSNYEKGIRTPDDETYKKLAAIYGVEVEKLKADVDALVIQTG